MKVIMENAKTLYSISWQVTEPEYRADSAYSYSTIARFTREGFGKLNKLFDRVESSSLTFGSMVDTLLTDGQEAFNNLFLVATFPNISDNLINIAKYLYANYGSIYRNISDIPDDILKRTGKEYDYYASDKYAAYRVKKIKEECAEYYNLLFLAEGKTVVSSEEYQNTLDAIEALRTDPYTKWYFEQDNPFDGIERCYQLKFKGEYEGITLRCMPDLIIINHNDKLIIPCDLKTSSKDEYNFHHSFIDWSYFEQAQLYWYIIRQNLDKDEYFKDFRLADYRFIVVNKKNKLPLVWEYTDTACVQNKEYGKNNQFKCPNWRNKVKELHYYLTEKPKYPIGIKAVNNIIEWLNNE